MSLRIRRGTDAQRSGITFDQGEIIWTTDTEKLYVGDGITQGGKNIGAQLAGTGLQWNDDEGVLETGLSSVNTDQISEGSNNRYFTVDRAQDAAASLFTTGTHSGITFTYDDVLDKINTSVTIGLEDIQDQMASFLVSGTNVGIYFVYDDTLGTMSASLDTEYLQDQMASFLVSGTNLGIYFVYDDTLGTISASVDTEYLQDQMASLLVNSTNVGIQFVYDDTLGTISASVDTALINDISPQLGNDLDLNSFDIIGVGNIDYFGDFYNGSIALDSNILSSNTGSLGIGSAVVNTNIDLWSGSQVISTFRSKTDGSIPSAFLLDGYKDSFISPSNFVGNDVVSVIAMRGYQPATDSYKPTFSLYGLFDNSANFTKERPRSSLIISTGDNTDNIVTLGNRYVFDGNGQFSAPMLKTGTFSNTIDRDNNAYTATPGTMIFLESDGIATEITGYTAVSSGAMFDIDLSQNVYTPTLTNAGTGYTVGEIINISGLNLNGSYVNDLNITVTAITGLGTTGPVDTFTVSGTGVNLSESYTDVSQSSTSGDGEGALFIITVENNQTYSVVLTNAGLEYAVSDTLTFLGTLFGGTSPTNDLTVSVTAVIGSGSTGSISTFSFGGVSPIITETFTSISPTSTSNTTTIMTASANASQVGKVVNGQGIPSGTTVLSADTGVSITISDPTTLNVASSQFVIVDVGVPRFQGCTVAGSGEPGDPGFVAPTWVSLN